MFIGELEVASVEKTDGVAHVTFTDETTGKVNENLYDLICSEEKGNGNITDNVRDFFARKFLAELSTYDLNYYLISNIAISMETLGHNLREQLLAKTFGCTGGNDISLKLLVDSIVDEK
jgi:hypothetical protein